MSGNRMPRAGEAHRYRGVVTDVSDSGVISAKVPGLADTVIDQIIPGVVGPLCWTPKRGQKVWIEERAAKGPEEAPTWVGWPHLEVEDLEALRENATVLMDPGKEILIVLDGGTRDLKDDDGTPGDIGPALYIGRDEAEDAALLGTKWKTDHEEVVLGAVSDALQAMSDALGLIQTTVYAVAGATATPPVGYLSAPKATLDAKKTAIDNAKTAIDNVLSKLVWVAEE